MRQKHEGCWSQILPILIGLLLSPNVLEKTEFDAALYPLKGYLRYHCLFPLAESPASNILTCALNLVILHTMVSILAPSELSCVLMDVVVALVSRWLYRMITLRNNVFEGSSLTLY